MRQPPFPKDPGPLPMDNTVPNTTAKLPKPIALMDTFLKLRKESLDVGYGIARDIAPSLLDRTNSPTQAIEIVTLMARGIARAYEKDLASIPELKED